MSDFAALKDKPDTKKIILAEIDIAQEHAFWTNYRAHVWYVNFEKDYPDIADWFLIGVEAQAEITRIGSVKVDSVSLVRVSSAADCQTNNGSFYYDDTDKELFVHCFEGDQPWIHVLTIGVAWGFRKGGTRGVYNNFIYEARLLSIPGISKRKDPLFFGKISFEGGDIEIENTDGKYDMFAEENDVFGNAARLLQGFDDLDYSDFLPTFSGFMENISIGSKVLRISIQDRRKQLSRKIPTNLFDSTTYPDIKESNVGKVIPIGYGILKNVPVICTNEKEAGPPADYHFKLSDTIHHFINAIDEVRVKDVAVVPSATSLANGTFSLAAVDYDPGNQVTCDFKGFEDPLGVLIENGMDVVADLMTSYYGVLFNANFYNIARWFRAWAADVGIFINKKTQLINVIGDIAATVQGDFIIDDDGRYSFRIFSEYAPAVQIIRKEELLEIPQIDYDPTEVLTSLSVGYCKDWKENEYLILPDTSKEAEVFDKFKTYRSKFFPTLLTSQADAQAFATRRLDLSSDVKKIFPVRTKPQSITREIGDMITVEIYRPTKALLGNAKAEVLGINKDGNGMTVELECRLLELLPETKYEQGTYYGDSYYNDNYYGRTQYREIV